MGQGLERNTKTEKDETLSLNTDFLRLHPVVSLGYIVTLKQLGIDMELETVDIKVPTLFCEYLDVVKKEFPEAIIAGGCLRDTVMERPAKDIDIFVSGLVTKDHGTLHSILDKENFKVIKEKLVKIAFELGIQKPKCLGWCKRGVGNEYEWNNSYIVSFEYEIYPYPVQLVFEDFNTDGFVSKVLSLFHVGFSQIAFNGTDVYVTPLFKEDVANRQMTLTQSFRTAPMDTFTKYQNRLRAKYPGIKIVRGL